MEVTRRKTNDGEEVVTKHDEGREGQDFVKLLQIPKDVIFPLELNVHLKDKLQAALDEIFCLKKQLFNQDYLLAHIHKEQEKRECDQFLDTKNNRLIMANPHMATKVVELSKKIRDMTAERESIKTRMKQVMAENEKLQNELRECKQCSDITQSYPGGNGASSKPLPSEEDLLSTAQQMANLTNKMMDYRRQSQQLRIELRTALKALSLEVGDGTTPQNVLSAVSQPSWRGRQQQILTLQQKLNELQTKIHSNQLSQAASLSHLGGGEGTLCANSQATSEAGGVHGSQCLIEVGDDARSILAKSTNVSGITLAGSASHRRLQGLQQQEQNKHEQLEKLNQEVNALRQELKTSSMSCKANKARVQTLEEQGRHYRAHIETVEGKLGEKQLQLQENLALVNRTHHEMEILKDRIRASRDTANEEILNMSQQLYKEKTASAELKKEIEIQAQELNKLTNEVFQLQSQLSHFGALPQGEMSAVARLQELQSELEISKQALAASDNEIRRLLSLMEESVLRVDEERSRHCDTQRHIVKAFAVIDFAEHCIGQCLDIGQINEKNVLAAIEDLKSMKRELKTGDLFHIEPTNVSDVRKLKARIRILNSEIGVLQKNIRSIAAERKKDLQNFATMVEKTREEFKAVATNSSQLFRCQTSSTSLEPPDVTHSSSRTQCTAP